MPTITIKDISADLYQQLKRAAELNRRSINSEVIVCIERAVRSRPLDTEALLARARELRAWTDAHPIADEAFSQAKTAGRP